MIGNNNKFKFAYILDVYFKWYFVGELQIKSASLIKLINKNSNNCLLGLIVSVFL